MLEPCVRPAQNKSQIWPLAAPLIEGPDVTHVNFFQPISECKNMLNPSLVLGIVGKFQPN